jgi:hypothetical protein
VHDGSIGTLRRWPALSRRRACELRGLMSSCCGWTFHGPRTRVCAVKVMTNDGRILCSPATPSDQCWPCVDEDAVSSSKSIPSYTSACTLKLRLPSSTTQAQTYCYANGFKQQVRCANASEPSSSYVTFQSCALVPGDFLAVVRFEVSRCQLQPMPVPFNKLPCTDSVSHAILMPPVTVIHAHMLCALLSLRSEP